MKKNLFLVLFMLVALCSLQAAEIRHAGVISLRPRRVVDPIPTITPLSEPIDVFSLFSTEYALELTSESADGQVFIYITGPSGVVYSSYETMSAGSEEIISVESFPAGAYNIYIVYNATIYVGEFEVE